MKLSLLGKIAFFSFIAQAIVLTVLECVVVYFHVSFVHQYILGPQGDGISDADLIYHALFILSLGFQILMCIDALRNNNSIQLVSLVIFNLLSLAYAGIQIYQHIILEERGTDEAIFVPSDMYPTSYMAKHHFTSRMRPLEYTIIGLVAVFSVYLCVIAYKLVKEFGWEIYKTYSADVEIKRAFINLSILQTLIKMDIFFIGAYAIQLLPSQQIGYDQTVIETVLIFVIGVIMMAMAWYSVVKELKYLLLSVINALFVCLIYIGYKLVRINLPKYFNENPDSDPYQFTRRFLTFFLGVTFLLVIFSIIYAIICFRNMMNGIYVLTVYGVNNQAQESPHGNAFDEEEMSGVYSKQQSKRQSKITELARFPRRLSLD
ncbi:16276_t:CDS:2 [Entrophospora sp. SA101]|nr:7855_t:CDS:2 [Entrophospora sp. SA101]CAJ0745415.1 1360_t:CDS:2 [Entrophospora sp. SA101]CAJ0769450.1 16276_t:CDS:2 [Entrophospora sp. SA101]CAJ0866162.1 14448_t:CDS:2 [Entrophospora sp. SA101]CAJ0911071.1 9364_t:CDS:2 [Entrophospora sp. SA101]